LGLEQSSSLSLKNHQYHQQLPTTMAINKRRLAALAREARKKAKSREQPPPPTHNLILDLLPEIRNLIFEYCLAASSRIIMKDPCFKGTKPNAPGSLVVNRQIRDEALPIFYSTNEFRFQLSHGRYITKWLFHGVQPKHLRFINSISWTAPVPSVRGSQSSDNIQRYSKNLQDQAIHLASVIMLLELGLLGKCKLQMTLYYEPRYHVACVLRHLVRKQITRKSLTAADTWNENAFPGEDDVAGLSYAILKEWAKLLPGIFQQHGWMITRLAPETCCPFCLPVYTPVKKPYRSYIPWVKQDEKTASSDGQDWWGTVEEDD
jgi:hypothetical protein